MSKLVEYRELERDLAEQMARLDALKSNSGLEKEIEFEHQLHALLAEYSKNLIDIKSLLDPSPHRALAPATKQTRRARVVKVYRNPLTGEVVESKGGNNKLLGSWKARFGAGEVESWLQA